MNHYKSGNTQLARDVSSLGMLDKILLNPRVHTNKGRHVGHLQHDGDDGYRSGCSSGGYYSPRNNYFSDDGYSPRNDYFSRDYHSPRNNYFSDDGYSPRNNNLSHDGHRSRASQSRDGRLESSGDRGGRAKPRRDWSRSPSHSRDNSNVRTYRSRSPGISSRGRRHWSRSRSRSNSSRGRNGSSWSRGHSSRVRSGWSRRRSRSNSSRDRSPRRRRRSRKG